mmetsp:Transcript_91465/g.259028  ORF Transcript_91465/g.259028 Transcript_91465/m.259028 type:complete len:106 (-) Transcript_91465:62-379(-)
MALLRLCLSLALAALLAPSVAGDDSAVAGPKGVRNFKNFVQTVRRVKALKRWRDDTTKAAVQAAHGQTNNEALNNADLGAVNLLLQRSRVARARANRHAKRILRR